MSQRFLPKRGIRGTSEYVYFELSMALGPVEIGETADNSYEALYGRAWLMEVDVDTDTLFMYQQDEVGEWTRVTAGLPPIFDSPIPTGAKRFTFAFDQSARVIVVYELNQTVLITRWNAVSNQYVQNVTFDGVDPAVIMDATLTDPRGYPTAEADGWGVRDAFEAGIPVLFEWLAGDPIVWLEDAIPDSDVLIFYLTPDRLGVRARVQRQLYETVQSVHDYDAPVVMDRIVALPGRYQALVSDAAGAPLPNMLISDPYLGDFIISPVADDVLGVAVTLEAVRADNDTYEHDDADEMTAGVAPEAIVATGDTLFYDDAEAATAAVSVEKMQVVGSLLATADAEDMTTAVAVASPIEVVTTTVPVEEQHAVDAAVAPEAIRVQTV